MEKKAVWNIIAAAALWGCIGVFLKLLTAAGLSSMDGVALRSAVAALLYGLFLAATDRKALKIQPRHWYYFFGPRLRPPSVRPLFSRENHVPQGGRPGVDLCRLCPGHRAAPAGPAVCVLSDDTIWIRSRIWLRSVFNFWQAGP